MYVYVCTCVCVYPCIHCISGQGDYANLKPNHFSHGKQPAGNTSGTESTTKRCQSQQRCLSYSCTMPLGSAMKIIGLEKATHHPTTLLWGLARPILRAISESRRPGWGLTSHLPTTVPESPVPAGVLTQQTSSRGVGLGICPRSPQQGDSRQVLSLLWASAS